MVVGFFWKFVVHLTETALKLSNAVKWAIKSSVGCQFRKSRFQKKHIDRSAIEFSQQIRRLFDFKWTLLSIGTHKNQKRSWEIICHQIWLLINDKICGLKLSLSELDRLRQFSPTVLGDCAQLREIQSGYGFPMFPADDGAGASSRQALAKWLHTPRGDALPKVLQCGFCSERMEGLKNAFVNSVVSVNFIINIWDFSSADIVPFELKNNLTGERLVFRQFYKNYCLLVRCPIERDKDKWANWERAAAGRDWCQWNRVSINFKDCAIGDGHLDENEGPSEPKKRKD